MNTHPDTPRNRGDKDAPHFSPVLPSEDLRSIAINQVAWGAIFAGVAVGLITQLLLNMLGLGIGLATLDPGTSDNPSVGGFSIGAGVWWVLSGIIASFVGGWIAGRLAGKPRESTGGWHGVTAWAVTALIVIYLLTSAVGGILGGALGALGNAAGGVARTASTAAAAAAPAAQGQGDEIASAVRSTVEQARERAEQVGAQARANAPELRARAAQTAENAANAASAAALVSALSLILGAAAAWFGGRRGAVHPTVTPGLRA